MAITESSAGSSPQPSTTLDVSPIAGALGAEVRGIDLGRPLSDGEHESIRQALLDNLVLFFPGQSLDPARHREFASRWGEMEIHPFIPKVHDFPEVVELRASRGYVADVWHTDVTFSDRPPVMSILNMVTSPPVGGDTMWSNLYAAYDALSAPMRELLDGLTAVHTARVYGSPETRAEHPAVRVHPETGRRCLYVNAQFTDRFSQLSRDESDVLLGYLTRFAVEPRFTVRHRWTPGTIAIWDNRCTQHFVLNDFEGERIIQRVTILGDLPEGNEPRWPHFPRPAQMSAAASRELL
jgi:taurine dioxygenase